MRFPIELIRSRHLSRVAVIALLAGFTASCSDSTMRFSSNPFSNPFDSQPDQVAYNAPRAEYRAPQRSYAEPNNSVNVVPATQPIAAQPLPPVGSVSQRSVPQTQYRMNRGEQPIVTGAISTPEPQIGGFKAGGWSAQGGTPVTVAAGENVTTLSNRYGVPSDAIMKVNGLTSRELSPGQQITIPVYNASAKTTSDPATQSVPVKTRHISEEQPYPGDPVAVAEPARASVGEAKVVRPVATMPAVVQPRGGIHVVKPGETLTSIAKAYGTTRPRLAKENGIDEWMSVKIGQQLKVPGPAQTAAAPAVHPRTAPTTAEVVDNRPPRDVPAAPRETIKPIASSKPVVSTHPVAAAKPVAPPKAIVAAQAAKSTPVKAVKVVPQKVAASAPSETQPKHIATKPVQTTAIKPVAAKPAQAVASAPVYVEPVKTVEAKQADAAKAAKLRAQKLADAKARGDKLAAAKMKSVTTRPAQVAQAKPLKPVEAAPPTTSTIPTETSKAQPGAPQTSQADAAQANANGNPEFRWPVKGRVIQDFGQNSDGINISVPEGTEVKAAEDGVVAYAGNELKGYGNLILIRHPNGYVTAYGHAKDLEVKKGDAVKRGQTIATAGQTGNVTSPQLLFEVRKGAAPVNPRQYLSGT
jgi:murein DD-endopeptidase MepM/ murein hydrolase activator NlpD